MKYINTDDLETYIQKLLLNGSIPAADGTLDTTILDNIETRTIDLVISYIGGRYDTSKIFADTVIRNGVLVEIISMIVIYRCVKRNAARKVPDDFGSFYTDSIKMLEKIQSGSQYLENLPLITATDGTTASLVYGNNTNKDYFI
jgi:phage gp36-like protein